MPPLTHSWPLWQVDLHPLCPLPYLCDLLTGSNPVLALTASINTLLANIPRGIPLVTFIDCAWRCILLDLISIWPSWSLPLQSFTSFPQDIISPSSFLHFLPPLLYVFFFFYLPLKSVFPRPPSLALCYSVSIYPTSEIISISMVSTVIVYLILIGLYIQLHGGYIHQRTFQNPHSQTEI